MLIPLRARDGSIRAHATIDDQDAHHAEHRWHIGARGYVCRNLPGSTGKEYLHREILGLTPGDGLEGDHIDGNHLDCRRANLRIVTHAQNMENVTARGGTSRHRGVSMHKPSGRWQAHLRIAGHKQHLGYFTDEDAAADACRRARAALTHVNENRSIAA